LKPERGFVRPAVRAMEEQQILAVAKLAMDDPDVIAMWYGESDVVTAPSICRPVCDSLSAGETYYTHKQGIPALRSALTGYLNALHGAALDTDRVTVTSSGMTAIMLFLQCVIEPGDNVVIMCPEWPNAQSAVRVAGGEVRDCPMTPGEDGRWHLDLERLQSLCDERTRAIFINSPNNPTGWVMPEADIRAMIAYSRKTGIWIIADEVYDRLVYSGAAAPSFLTHIGPDDPVVIINSFSKSWAMTGWRVGWMVHPHFLNDVLGNIIEFNYSCVPEFVQKGALEAIRNGGGIVREMVEYCRTGRDLVAQRLPAIPGIESFSPAEAAFYAYFRIKGSEGKTLQIAQNLVRSHSVGIAPGTAFGPTSDGWFRICFALEPARLSEGLDRLNAGLRALY